MKAPLTEEEIEQEAMRRLADFASFFHNSLEGPRILGYLKAALDGNSYRPGMDALETAYHAGRRSVYLDIVSHVGEGREVMDAREQEPRDRQPEAQMNMSLEDY